MKWLSMLLLFCFGASAQESLCKNFTDIPAIERRAYETKQNFRVQSQASSNFSIHYCRCIWKVDPAIRYIEGKVTSYFTALANTNSLTFDLTTQLTVDSVIFKTQKISFQQQANQTLALQLAATVNAQQKDSVTIYYHGVPDKTGFGSFIQQTHNNVPVIWTLSEPYGSKDWWPCRNGLDDKVDSIDIYIVHPSQYKSTANGLLQYEQTVANTTTTYYKHRYPIAAYLVAFSVTNFSVFNNTVQLGNISLPMISYIYPESLVDFQTNTPKVLAALQLYHNTFGPYPFINEKYGHTQFAWGGGMEHQTNTFISSSNTNLMAHELGHQWFGDKITCGSWQDIWLNESFATFASNFFMEKTDTAAFQSFINNQLNNITSQPGGAVFVADTTDPNRIFNSRLSYDKGANVLRMLRFTIGDSSFFRGIRQYLTDSSLQYRFAKTVDFKRNMEQVSGKDLTYFFNQWIYGEGYPSFNIQWSQNANNWAKIKVNETTSHNSVSFFKTPLALTFKNTTQQKTIIVQCNYNDNEIWADIGFTADTVWVDVEKQLISKNNNTEKLSNTSIAVNDIKLYPNPVKDILFINLKNPVEKKLLAQLFNVAGQLIYQQTFDTPGQDELLQIAFSNYAKGTYILKLDAGNSVHLTKKLIK
jgi:aminopeptidase N